MYSEYTRAELERESVLEEAVEKAEVLGMEKGIEQGEHNKQIEIAYKMLEEEMDKNIVARITGLSIEEIEKMNR